MASSASICGTYPAPNLLGLTRALTYKVWLLLPVAACATLLFSCLPFQLELLSTSLTDRVHISIVCRCVFFGNCSHCCRKGRVSCIHVPLIHHVLQRMLGLCH